ncbi:hypothetical protein QQP08_012077, partial [Theobroma cacao]
AFNIFVLEIFGFSSLIAIADEEQRSEHQHPASSTIKGGDLEILEILCSLFYPLGFNFGCILPNTLQSTII